MSKADETETLQGTVMSKADEKETLQGTVMSKADKKETLQGTAMSKADNVSHLVFHQLTMTLQFFNKLCKMLNFPGSSHWIYDFSPPTE
jgi:hypothetical protein